MRSADGCAIWAGVSSRPRLHRALSTVACYLAVCSFAGRSLADSADPLKIRWVAPLDCPRADLDQQLARLFEGDPPPGEADVDVSTLAGPHGYRLHLRLVTKDQPATRELALSSCADVRHAAALLIATALQESAPASPRTAADAGLKLQLGVVGDALSLPAVSGGPELGVAWHVAGWRFALEGRYLLSREARDDDSQVRTDVDLLAGSLGAEFLVPLGPFQVGPGIAAELGRLGARSRGELAQDASAWWASALVGARLVVPWSDRIGCAVSARLSVPLRRPSLSLKAEAPFYETSRVAVRLGVSLDIQLGDKRSSTAGQ